MKIFHKLRSKIIKRNVLSPPAATTQYKSVGFRVLENRWQSLLDKHGGACDINIGTATANVLKNWCKSNGYVCEFFCQHGDYFTYVIAKTKELYKRHESIR